MKRELINKVELLNVVNDVINSLPKFSDKRLEYIGISEGIRALMGNKKILKNIFKRASKIKE